ncbi:hypothetical protein HU200_003398 [Digitaria exilis]|uniref:Uncharacterized protein n=1 Tax=Digitaria exilis TaxID=1010633 RepID=A0A835FVQ0_9POAL|nr:hypothetical protein HU200_003398 [Digitaria exilis]
MAAATSSSLLLLVVLLLVLAASAAPATADDGKHVMHGISGARMVIVRHSSGTPIGGGAVSRARANTNSKWHHHGRPVEDEVAAEELGLSGLPGAGGKSIVADDGLDKDRPGCLSSGSHSQAFAVHARAYKQAETKTIDNNMPAGHHLQTLAVLLLLLAASPGPVATAAYKHGGGGGRMVIIVGAPGRCRGGGRSRSSRYDDERRRLVEDEVAPELATAAGLLGADVDSFISSQALKRDRPVCLQDSCAGNSGQPYTRSCLLGC